MPEEIAALVADIADVSTTSRGGRVFHAGTLLERNVVAVFSRWGKVAAAATTAELILDHEVSCIVFSGIAGGLGAVHRGDVVVARSLVQHDLDASPYFPPTHVPMLGIARIPTDDGLSAALDRAAADFLATPHERANEESLWSRADIFAPRVHRGTIASGDQVIFSDESRRRVLAAVPDALCVEMEGAAAAQVCFEHSVPFACVRTISDSADDSGHEHVKPFFEGLAGIYTRGIFKRFLQTDRASP